MWLGLLNQLTCKFSTRCFYEPMTKSRLELKVYIIWHNLVLVEIPYINIVVSR